MKRVCSCTAATTQIADLGLLPDDLLSSGDELPNQGQLQDHRVEGEDVLGDTTGKLVLHLFLEEESVRGSYIHLLQNHSGMALCLFHFLSSPLE